MPTGRKLDLEHDLARLEGQLTQGLATGANAYEKLGVDLRVVHETSRLIIDRPQLVPRLFEAVRLLGIRFRGQGPKPPQGGVAGFFRSTRPVDLDRARAQTRSLRRLII